MYGTYRKYILTTHNKEKKNMWNFIKVYYYHFVHFQLKGIKPTRYRENFEEDGQILQKSARGEAFPS